MAAQQGNRGRLSAIVGLAGGLALLSVSAPAQAQFFGGWWGGWRPVQAVPYDTPIPPQRVARILASKGFSLSAPPRRQGEIIVAEGVDRQGQRMRFVLDAYDGEVLHGRLVGPPRPPALIGRADTPAMAPRTSAGLLPDEGATAAIPGAHPQLGAEPQHPLQKPKPKPKAQPAAHSPAKVAPPAVVPKVPSQAETVNTPAVTQEPATAPAAEANAPATAPATPLAPDAAPASPPAAPAAAATEARAPGPATGDIGPVVRKVEPAAAAPAAAEPSEAKPAE
ncbi:MAG: hypothetical protein NVSMB26_03620 [Beijerinckiaceae bacterium]